MKFIWIPLLPVPIPANYFGGIRAAKNEVSPFNLLTIKIAEKSLSICKTPAPPFEGVQLDTLPNFELEIVLILLLFL